MLSIATFAACSSSPKIKSQDRGAQMNQIVDQYFEENLRLDPLFATAIGDHRFDDQMVIGISEETKILNIALVQKSLNAIHALGCQNLNRQDTLTCETFTADLESLQKVLQTQLSDLMPFNQLENFLTNFALLASGTSFVTFNSELDYENFYKRMRIVPAYVDTMILNMNLGIRKKITTPRILVQKALKQLDRLLPKDYTESVFYKPLLSVNAIVKDPKKAESLKALYSREISESIYPSYKKLQKYARDVYLPATRTTSGLRSIPGGKEYYLSLVKFNTTTDLTPDQIMELGLAQVSRISEELEQVKQQLHYPGSLKSFYHSLRSGKKLYPFHTSEEVMAAYESIHQRVLKSVPEHFRLLPKAKFEIREVEKFKAENASEAYENADPNGTRPGIFWVPIPHPEKYPFKDMESTFLHEAIPGHHFQISIQQELSLPRYRRFGGNAAYAEGWALYTESLGKDLGMYTDPYQWIGRLANEMMRAVRLVVDTGIHWKGWSREKAIQYSLDHEPYDADEIVSEIERYMANPGQALAYKIGEAKILELKARAKQALGSRYSDLDFHDEILKDGNLPLSVLDRKINHWLQNPFE